MLFFISKSPYSEIKYCGALVTVGERGVHIISLGRKRKKFSSFIYMNSHGYE